MILRINIITTPSFSEKLPPTTGGADVHLYNILSLFKSDDRESLKEDYMREFEKLLDGCFNKIISQYEDVHRQDFNI